MDPVTRARPGEHQLQALDVGLGQRPPRVDPGVGQQTGDLRADPLHEGPVVVGFGAGLVELGCQSRAVVVGRGAGLLECRGLGTQFGDLVIPGLQLIGELVCLGALLIQLVYRSPPTLVPHRRRTPTPDGRVVTARSDAGHVPLHGSGDGRRVHLRSGVRTIRRVGRAAGTTGRRRRDVDPAG
ncbi:MAG TPA: hypothetical protein VK923_03895 [Euzebyales bacterium]|nr:hypothetical protein [Euzebyales bacterium]